MYRILAPTEKEWRTITYHPQPFATRTSNYHAEEYWKGVYGPNTRVEVRPEPRGFMSHLRDGVAIWIIPDPDKTESYVEPLATIHGQFFDMLSALTWGLYPFNPRNKKKFAWGGRVHSLLSDLYWRATDWQQYTPDSWVEQLNSWLALAEQHTVRSEDDLAKLREACLECAAHGVGVQNGDYHVPDLL